MAEIVVGGSSKEVGKTTLICGLIAAFPELAWTAVKITSHRHGNLGEIWEENNAGQGTDTARYLAAGARRALLVTAQNETLAQVIHTLRSRVEAGSSLIFESNRIVDYLQPDLCLAVDAEGSGTRKPFRKPSFEMLDKRADAIIRQACDDRVVVVEKPIFHLVKLDRISLPLQQWLRRRLMGR